MSRTFRRKNTTNNGMWMDLDWFISEQVYPWETGGNYHSRRVPFEKGTKKYKKGLARFHSDGCTNTCKEPGPGWFRRLFNTKPSRAGARIQINRWLRNEEYEVVAETHPHLPYWT